MFPSHTWLRRDQRYRSPKPRNTDHAITDDRNILCQVQLFTNFARYMANVDPGLDGKGKFGAVQIQNIKELLYPAIRMDIEQQGPVGQTVSGYRHPPA